MKRDDTIRMRRQVGTLTAAALLCCASAAFGQTGNQGSMGNGQQGSMQQNSAAAQNGNMNNMSQTGQMNDMGDKAFLKKAMEGGMAEVAAGKLALSKSNNDQVKQFAQRMVDDHTKLNEEAKPVAQQAGVSIPDGPSKKDKALMAKMEGLSGDAFDKAYIEHMVKDHQADDKDFKSEAANGQNPQIKAMAARAEPIIASHLQMVEGIAKSMNIGKGM